ncbi:MAG: TonB-dependent receptor [Balneolaceae bacterium]
MNEIVISASRYKQPASSVGRNVTVIDHSEIKNSIHTTVGGLLSQQQGVHVVGNSQTDGSVQSIFLRNSNSNQTVVMIDGVRISDPSTAGNSVNLSELSLAGVKRIEIVRGSHSTLYGSSAIGGVINIITEKTNSRGVRLNLDTEGGAIKSGVYSTRNNLSLQGTLDNGLYANLAVSQDYTNGLDATVDTASGPGFNSQDRDGFRKLDFYGKAGYHGKLLDLYGSYRHENQHLGVDQGAFQDDNNAYQDFHRDLFSYGVSSRLSSRLGLKLEGAYSTLNRAFVNDSSIVDQQGSYDHTYAESHGEGSLWQNGLTVRYEADNAKFMMGLESNHQTMNNRSYTYVSSYNYESETNLDSLNLNETTNSIFLHTDLNGSLFADNWDAFSLVLGSRLSHHDQFGSHFTYEINPSVQLTSSVLVYGAITTGFNAPSLYQLYAPQKSFGAYTTRGNASLEPEESTSYEIGWKQEASRTIRFELSFFQTNIRNTIEYIYLWNGNTAESNLTFGDYLGDTYLNVSRQYIRGIELDLNMQPAPSLSFSGNLSYIHSKLVFNPGDIDQSYTGGNHVQVYESGTFVNSKRTVKGLSRRPRITANFRMGYRPFEKVRLGISSRFIGARDDIFYSSNLGPYGALDRSRVDGYNLTDVKMLYDFNAHISVGIKVENILDTQYYEINGYRTKGRGVFLKAAFSY